MFRIVFNPLTGQFDLIFVPQAGASETFAFFMGG